MLGDESHRIEIDIGCGLGSFTLAAALEFPHVSFIGIDLNEKSFEQCEENKRNLGIKNAHFFHAEALSYFERYVPDKSISAFHIYFPTPYVGPIRRTNVLGANLDGWLFGPRLLAELLRTSMHGAQLRFVTDHSPYFEYASRIVAVAGLTAQSWIDPIHRKPVDQLIGTGCERRQRNLNKQIKYLQCTLK